MYIINKDKSVTITNSAYQSYSMTYVEDDSGNKLESLSNNKIKSFAKQKSDELEQSIVNDMVTRECKKLRQEFAVNNDPTMKYTKQEINMFPVLQKEYFDGAFTPYINMLAKHRGITRDKMLKLVGKKIDDFGKQHGLLYKKMDQLKSAKTIEEVLNIIKDFNNTGL